MNLIKKITGDSQKEAQKVFSILQQLADSELDILFDEINSAPSASIETAQLLQFKANYPILFMVAFSRRSSALTS